MQASNAIDWQLHFGWSDDYLKRHDRKAEKSKDSVKELVEIIDSIANPLIRIFTAYGKKQHNPIYSSPHGRDAGMVVFLYTLSKWEGDIPFLIQAADAQIHLIEHIAGGRRFNSVVSQNIKMQMEFLE